MSHIADRSQLDPLLRDQRFAALATEQAGAPYANLVAFAATPDLRALLFATPRGTRKYANLCREPRVALLIDNRANEPDDIHSASVVTALGRATAVAPAEQPGVRTLYLQRHPALRAFAEAADTVFFRIAVDRYVLVDHFQHVTEFDVAQWT